MAFPLKAAANRCHGDLRRELREKAPKQKVRPIYRCGPYEVLRVAFESCQCIKKQNEADNTLLKALRRNGFLAYRPDFEQGRLVKCDEQAWARELKQGNHRMPAAWIKKRYDFLDERGVPLEATWEGCGAGVTRVEDMEDATQHGPPGTRVELKRCQQVEPEGVEEASVELQCDVDESVELPEQPSGWVQRAGHKEQTKDGH